ncbi:MAG: FAD-binding oxidoreductase [Lachnospiraceae bacterium]|nr:FAD-binding oxidoreductase [Lachnospiraceae bacterium]
MEEYGKVTPEIVEQLKAVTAENRVFTGENINDDFSHDEMSIYGKKYPDVVVSVLSTEEVSEVMKIAYANNIPTTPRGAGTGLVGAAVPLLGGLLIDMTRMNQILGYDLDNLVVKVQPGVLWNDLDEDCAKRGLMYPPDPGEKFATLGGNASTNAGGMRAVKYGVTREYVRAMTVVMTDGTVIKLGSTVSKTSSGYSLLNLMIGSEGTLGIITELTLKLIPIPSNIITMVIPFETLEDCIATVPKFKLNHMNPQTLEFMEKKIVEVSETYMGKAVYPKSIDGVEAGAYLLVTFDGESEEECDALVEKAAEMVLENGAIDVMLADSPAKRKDAWSARSAFLEAIKTETNWRDGLELLDECDIVVPVNQIAPFVKYTYKVAEELGLNIESFGHAGDGNLHIYILGDKEISVEDFKAKAEQFFDTIYPEAFKLGGLVSGEHAIGSGKLKYLSESVGPVQMKLMEDIKRVFDPKMILNPGKVCYKL